MLRAGHLRVGLEEMQLRITDPEPVDGHPEVRRRQALQAEDVFVEAPRLLEIVGDDRDVVDPRRAHYDDMLESVLGRRPSRVGYSRVRQARQSVEPGPLVASVRPSRDR